jgi:hypothetical protein
VSSELARRLESIADPALRVGYLRHLFATMSPEEIADIFVLAVHGAEARNGSLGALLLASCLALADEGSAELRASVARAAIARGQHEVAGLLSTSTPEQEGEPFVVPDHGTGRQLTLGERKSLARRRDRDLLAHIRRDPHPDVIRVLLGNPAITEDDVIRIAAQRPVPPEVLREIFRSTRWVVRYRVRRAIVMNPCAPLDVALQLAAHLSAQDALEVANASELPLAVREAGRRVAGLGTIH